MGKISKRHNRSTKRRSTKRRPTKRHSTKRRPTKRRSTKRRTTKRRTTKRTPMFGGAADMQQINSGYITTVSTKNKNITTDSNTNKKKITNNNDLTLNLFHMKGCGHCTKLQPIWEKLKEKLKNENKDIITQINSYDVTIPSESKFIPADIKGFPTIRLYKDKTLISEYDGDRNEKDMYDWLCKYNFNNITYGDNNLSV